MKFPWKPISVYDWPYILHPRPVVIVAARWKDKYSAMAASWVMPVSRKPPIVTVAITNKRYTYELITKSKEFTINLLSKKYLDKIHFLGSVSGRDYKDKIRAAGLTIANAKKISAPIISESLAVAECKLLKTVEAGDHDLFLGEIIEVYGKTSYDISEVPLHVKRNKYTYSISKIFEIP